MKGTSFYSWYQRTVKGSYILSNSYVAGFGHPKYTEDPPAPTPAPAPTVTKVSVLVPVLQQGMTGSAAVKGLQRVLYARGIRDNAEKVIAVDGSFGASTRQAVVKLQKQLFPSAAAEWDGVVGAKTWDKMLNQLW